jgi:nucleotide-binding universal stress UspA family protein
MKLNIKRILVPTDFSEISFGALEYAAFLAKKLNAKITLLHVYEMFDEVANKQQIVTYRELLEKGISDKMKDITAGNKNLQGVKIDTKIVEGKTYKVINTVAEEVGADFVVMGTHGSSSVKDIEKFVLGSNAFRTVHESTIPVLTIRKGMKAPSCSSILLPLDVSKNTAQKVDFAVEWAKIFGSKIHLLAVTEMIDEFVADITKLNELVTETEIRLKAEKIQYTIKMFRNSTLTTTVFSHAKKMQADLVLIMSRKDSVFGEFLVPAADRVVIGESEIPVLSLRPTEEKKKEKKK